MIEWSCAEDVLCWRGNISIYLYSFQQDRAKSAVSVRQWLIRILPFSYRVLCLLNFVQDLIWNLIFNCFKKIQVKKQLLNHIEDSFYATERVTDLKIGYIRPLNTIFIPEFEIRNSVIFQEYIFRGTPEFVQNLVVLLEGQVNRTFSGNNGYFFFLSFLFYWPLNIFLKSTIQKTPVWML